MKKRNSTCLLLSLIVTTTTIYSCMTTIFNDSNAPILVVDHIHESNKNDSHPGLIVHISRNKQRRIGKAHEHANFTVYTKHGKSQQFIATYHVVQNECGANGNPTIKLSDLENGTGNTNLFTVTKLHSVQSPAMRELATTQSPDIFKNEPSSGGCSACSAMQ